LLISLPIGARLGSLLGLGELLGLLLAVPLASCTKTYLDAWGDQLRRHESEDLAEFPISPLPEPHDAPISAPTAPPINLAE
jgi:hypothetical protein